MNLTPYASASHWAHAYVLKLWVPDYTCWTMVQEVQLEVFGRTMPPLEIDVGAPSAENWATLRRLTDGTDWGHVEGDALALAREGDILMMQGLHGPHVGVVTGNGMLLHNTGGMVDDQPRGGVVLEPLADLGRLKYGHFKLWRAA